MIAVLFVTSSAVSWSALWLTLAVLAMGIGPLIGWRSVKVPDAVKRIGLAALIAVALAVPLYAVTCLPCQNCDPWWLEYFWICIPAQ